MSHDTRTFDGIDYPDGRTSDPQLQGWMRGSPPPQPLIVRFADDRFLEFPRLRWTLSHLRELVPTACVRRGHAPGGDLGVAAADPMAAIDALSFTDMEGRACSWAQSLLETYTDGIVVLHRGRCLYERYFGALCRSRPHACFSITKSYAATLAATLIHEGVLEEHRAVPYYLPELAGGAYAQATLRHLLDMRVGVAYTEEYDDSQADIWRYARAGGLRPHPAEDPGPRSLYDFLLTLRPQGEHGGMFDYKTVNTEVLCWIMKRVTGEGLADMLSRRLWSRLGCEEDGYLSVDANGVELGGAGLNAALRDVARFGELMRREGDWLGRQILPAAVVAGIRAGGERSRFAAADYPLIAGYSYRDMWWIAHDALGVFEARGIHGQRLYVAPGAELVIARFASHPIAGSAANDPITLPAFQCLARHLTAP